MFFLRSTVIATLCCFGTSVLASSWPLSIQGQPLPDKWFQMNLDQLETGPGETEFNSSLAKQTPITSCLAVLGGVLSCITVGALSDQHDCSTMSGTIDGVRYTYHSIGSHCDTTVQRDTIAGAIKKFLSNMEHNKICGTLCLRLNHGGTWNGWLKLGPVGSFNANANCGSGLPFNSCVSGSNNDI
ncbi:hypothetical protein BJX63DRAFT_419904 [Aspergillus granulosus]|uniref:Secreted protein CSS2 C-terminal domain-containing protein n=1 Tax=Aspergillus granulosus TaxID=176169 RepID=A0ABR4HML8_9EURO